VKREMPVFQEYTECGVRDDDLLGRVGDLNGPGAGLERNRGLCLDEGGIEQERTGEQGVFHVV